MNCQRIEEGVVDHARSMPMEASGREGAHAHCGDCNACAQRLTGEQLLSGGLSAFATEMKLAITPGHVQQNLISALRQQRVTPQPGHANHGWRYLAVAAAILVAVASGMVSYRMRPAEPVIKQVLQQPPIENPQQEVVAKMPTATPAIKQNPSPVVARKQRHRKLRFDASVQSTFVTVVVGAVTDAETSEVPTPFMALGYTNPANIQDGAQVVRVELPRYAMARFGLPVNMERYDERVKADVWLGTDGLARAIRFVQ